MSEHWSQCAVLQKLSCFTSVSLQQQDSAVCGLAVFHVWHTAGWDSTVRCSLCVCVFVKQQSEMHARLPVELEGQFVVVCVDWSPNLSELLGPLNLPHPLSLSLSLSLSLLTDFHYKWGHCSQYVVCVSVCVCVCVCVCAYWCGWKRRWCKCVYPYGLCVKCVQCWTACMYVCMYAISQYKRVCVCVCVWGSERWMVFHLKGLSSV